MVLLLLMNEKAAKVQEFQVRSERVLSAGGSNRWVILNLSPPMKVSMLFPADLHKSILRRGKPWAFFDTAGGMLSNPILLRVKYVLIRTISAGKADQREREDYRRKTE